MSTKEQQEEPQEQPSAIREFVSVAIVVGLIGLLTYGFVRDQASMKHEETALIVDVRNLAASHVAVCGLPTKDGRPTVISMMYSVDKQPWLEDAAQTFSKLCPNIQVKLQAKGDVAAVNGILSGTEKPTLWAPADELMVQYLDARWKKERPNDAPIYDASVTTSIAASPLVVLVWENRVQVVNRILEVRPLEHGPWVDILCPLVPIQPSLEGMAIADMVPGKWIDWYNPLVPPPPDQTVRLPKTTKRTKELEQLVEAQQAEYRAPFPSIEKIISWGRVKIAHVSPTDSTAGLETIYLMAYDYFVPKKNRLPEVKRAWDAAALDPAYRGRVFSTDVDKGEFARSFSAEKKAFGTWLRRCEAGLGPAEESAPLLTDTFFNLGEKRYDGIVTYEHLTFKLLKQLAANDRTLASMEVTYPSPTIMSQHPVATINADRLTSEQQMAAHKWVDYLRSVDIQKKAIEHGFRPVNRGVSIRDYDSEANPFLQYRRYGVDFNAPVIEPPRLDGNVVFDLVRMWEDATGRN